ncbi:MAG TPA: M20/M25/M40 family metallo-hydrolase, partial [Burkholderiales bacterium]|nr:M20/M25/M40 family metallo-hydrolase [Burkholderiales bacterium]
MDTLELARALISRRSVTPEDAGCLDLIAGYLEPHGFVCERMDSNGVSNLWARRGSATPLVCLAGHTDVVPAGPIDHWVSDPFEPVIREAALHGRGASDMKTSIA